MKKCCICEKEFEGFGNNPYPVFVNTNDDELKECCSRCNTEIVIPFKLQIASAISEARKAG